MDPHKRFCHNRGCWAYGRAGEGHIVIHSQKERRYRCKRCAKTFSQTKGTALYRMHKPHESWSPPSSRFWPMAVRFSGNSFAAFGLDERTIARWQRESGHQCGGASTNTHRASWRGASLSSAGRRVAYSYRRRRGVAGLGDLG